MSKGSYCAHRYRGHEYCTACQLIEVEAERNALREEVARLEKGRDEALERAAVSRGDANHCEQQAVNLRAALETWGRHDEGCARAGLDFKLRGEDYPCSCGLAEALGEKEGAG